MVLSLVFLYFTLGLCGVLLGVVVWKYDLYRREPWWLLLLAAALGAASIYAAGLVQVWMIGLVNARGEVVSDTVFAMMAGGTEEIGKLLAVLVIWAVSRKHFDEPIDGLIYGSLAGLGAALEESIAVLTDGPVLRVLPPQEPVRLAGHLIMGGIGGYGMGLLVVRHRFGTLALLGSLLAAIVLHTLWDVVAFAAADHYRTYAKLRVWQSALPVLLMFIGMMVYRRMVTQGSRLTRAHLNVCDVATRRCPPD